MASTRSVIAPILRASTSRCPGCLRPTLSQQPFRTVTNTANATKYNRKNATKKASKKKKGNAAFKLPDLKKADQFTLCDAMRYLRAFEVGRDASSAKYEVALRLRTMKNGPVIRNRFRLPHPVNTSVRIAVICSPESKYFKAAKESGAVMVGEDDIFEAVRQGAFNFDRVICQADSATKLQKAGIARILGPRGLMPNAKTGSIVKDPIPTVKDMLGGTEYRERQGVIRMAIGQLGFTPEEMQRNIKAFMDNIKKDAARIDQITKAVHEVVLSSTNGPGFSLNGAFRNADSLPTEALST